MKGLSSVLSSSSEYWKETFSNVDNFCGCSRPQVEVEGETAEQIYNNIQNNNINNSPQIAEIVSASISDPIQRSYIKPPENPGIAKNKRNWTQEEDNLLLSLTSSNFKHNWKSIAEKFENKTPQQISYRWAKLNTKEDAKWTRNEDIQLLELVESLGENWNAISIKMAGRSPENIQKRYETKLNPNLKRSKFEKEEDDQIIILLNKYGNEWTKIAKHFNNRSASMIKNRYYSFLVKKFDELKKKKNKIESGKTTSDYPHINQVAELKKNNEIKNVDYFNQDFNPQNFIKQQIPLPLTIEDNATSYFYESLLKSSSEYTQIYLENDTNFYNENILEGELNQYKYNYDNFEMDLDKYTQSDIPDLNRINLDLERSSGLSKTTSNGKTWKDDRENKKDVEMRYDDSETNNILQDLVKQDTFSPILNETNQNNFNEEYRNAFKSKKNSFESKDNSEEENEKNRNNENSMKRPLFSNTNRMFTNKFNFENEKLKDQYNMLEQVFIKVQQVNMSQALQGFTFNDVKNYTLNKKLEEKRENLSFELTHLKHEYTQYQSSTPSDSVQNNENIRLLLIKQIEILMELIKTTKYKISLLNNNNSPD